MALNKQQPINRRVFCLLLCGLAALCGCDKKPAGDAQQPMDFAVDKFYSEGPLSVRLEVSSEKAALSDLVTMRMTTKIEPDYDVQTPAVAETLKQFGIYRFDQQSQSVSDDNRTTTVWQYQLEPLETGSCEIDALIFEFSKKESPDDTPGTLTTEPVVVEITTAYSADADDFEIADISDVVDVKINLIPLWISLAAAALIAAGVVIGLRLRPKRPVEIRRVYRAAHEIAFEMLQAISRENLVEQGRVKEFYEKLSICLRQYIENRFRLRAPEQTTEEFLEQLKTSDALKLEYKQQLQKFLEHCDLVKFARYQPSHEQINESLTIAEQFVEQTRSEQSLVDVTDCQGEGA